jgi:putative transposase
MGRPLRLVADDLIDHALNRGNHRGPVFFTPDDYSTFLRALRQTKARYPFHLFGYCLMGNHLHLVLQPAAGQSISRIVQSLTVAHTWHYHKGRGSSGHVWQGRFKSPVLQDGDHLLTVLRYVEANPLRAGMVADLAGYPWSSYPAHGLGRADDLLDPVASWEELGRTAAARQAYWRKWLHTPLSDRELARVRKSVTSGRPFGSAAWTKATADRLGVSLTPRPRGRPRKGEKMN